MTGTSDKKRNKGTSQMKMLTVAERTNMNQTLDQILKVMSKQGLPDAALVRKAYVLALQVHGHDRRITGEPYIMHPLETAKILAETGHESEMAVAALLHDVVAECGVSLQQLEREFGTDIADTVNAVAEVGRFFSAEEEISKMDRDILSDVRFLEMLSEKHYRRAIYIKCADRIHNLRTIHVFSENVQKAKAYNTRKLLIPVAKKLHIHELADILGTLCLKIENAQVFNDIRNTYKSILEKNYDTLLGDQGLILSVKKMVSDDAAIGKYITSFEFVERREDSLLRDVSVKLHNIHDVKEIFTKKNVALYDVFFITEDSFADSPETLFFEIYQELHESKFRLTITGTGVLDDTDVTYYKMEDRCGNKFRLFIQSESEHREFIHGITEFDDYDMRNGGSDVHGMKMEAENRMITVFKKDGSPMLIKDGATVLDFAFAIDRNIGICAKYALVNGSNSQVPIYKKLSSGDMVEIISDHQKGKEDDDIPHATVRWFEYVNTKEATKALSRWLEKHMDAAVPKMLVYDEKGHEYEIEMASTVLDFAFAVGEKVGLHVKKAYVNSENVELDKTLRYGDKVRLEYDVNDIETPVFTWLSIVKTKYAKECLIAYFHNKYQS